MNTENMTTYYFDWIEVGKRKRSLGNDRILLYGDFFMHEGRYSVMKACHCLTDAIYTNKPLREVEADLRQFLTAYTYSLVVLGEGAGWCKEANCEYIRRLQVRYPYTRFVLATTPSYWMLPKRYHGDDACRLANNERCRQLAQELGIPCLDVAKWAEESGLGSQESAGGVCSKLALSYLKQLRISKAYKTLRTEQTPRNIMRLANILLAQMLGAEVKKISAQGAPTPEIMWKNKWEHQGATALIIGDSNTRRLCRASTYLTESVNMYATAAPMVSIENEEVICSMLTPQISHVCFSIGGHYLKCWNSDDFEERFSDFLKRLLQNNRKVLVLTLTYWSLKGNLTCPDVENNALIDQLNARMVKVAREQGALVMDFNRMMQGNPHSDYIHYVEETYKEPASLIVEWFQSDGLTPPC